MCELAFRQVAITTGKINNIYAMCYGVLQVTGKVNNYSMVNKISSRQTANGHTKPKNTSSLAIIAVKRSWQCLVFRWVTVWERHVLLTKLCPDPLWGPYSLLYNGCRVSLSGVKRWERGVNNPPHLQPRLKKE